MNALSADSSRTPFARMFCLPLRLREGIQQSAVIVSFQSTPFDVSAFAAAGIACPASILRSVKSRQAEFFHGRLAAREALTLAGAPVVDVPIGASREPVWPPGVVGSISHTGRHAAALVADRARCRGVGIDIEHRLTPEQQSDVAQVATDRDERKLLDSLLGEVGLDVSLALVFSAKEALFKAAFSSVGRYFDFDAAAVRELDLHGRRITLDIRKPLSAEFPQGRRCDVFFAFIDSDTLITSFSA